MFRFTMPKTADPEERTELLKAQCETFLRHRALAEIFSVLGTDRETFLERQRGGIVRVEDDGKKKALYPLLDALGFFGINRPLSPEYNHILVLGGKCNACYQRTAGAKKWISPGTESVDALTGIRRIGEEERRDPVFPFRSDTEFGVLTEAFSAVFGIGEDEWEEDYRAGCNENGSSCVRTAAEQTDGCRYRIYAAPSSKPAERRADTGDTFRYYLEKAAPANGSRLLAVTHNRYCNRQFLQLAYDLLKNPTCPELDVAGVVPDEKIVPSDRYDASAFLRDLSGVLYWIGQITAFEFPRASA